MNEEIPLRCKQCKHVNMVDIDSLSTRPVDKVVTEKGYVCPNCGKWEHVLYRTVSLDELLKKIEKLPVNSNLRKKLYRKMLSKAENLQERMRDQNGESRNSDKITS